MELDPLAIGLIALVAILGLWMLGAYQRVTGLRLAIVAAWRPIDPALRRRSELMLELVDALRERLPGERASFDTAIAAKSDLDAALNRLAGARRKIDPAAVEDLVRADAAAASVLARLRSLGEQDAMRLESAGAAARARPTLTAIAAIDPRMRFSRQAFNDAVAAYNDAVDEFPTRLLAPLFGFAAAARW